MLEKVDSYRLTCDGCGTVLEDGEFSIFEDEGRAIDVAIDEQWVDEGLGKWTCPNCVAELGQ